MDNITIQPYAPATDATAVTDLWDRTFPTYPIARDRLALLLDQTNGHHFVLSEQSTLIGFCACYSWRDSDSSSTSEDCTEPTGSGYFTSVIISPTHQGRGYGTKLLQHSVSFLWNEAKVKDIAIGSLFPRFWSGFPTDLSPKLPAFFLKNGFKETNKCRDLYRPLTNFTPASYQHLLERASSEGFTFRPLQASEYPECISGQEENFHWAAAYRALHIEGLDHEIFTAFDVEGKQVGWCMALSPAKSRIWNAFAFLPTVGGEDGVSGVGRVGMIGGVGTRKEMRGKGVGMALVLKAMEDLKRRDAELEGCFADWVAVALWDWYGKIGFESWREYMGMKMERSN
ncbi:MAG: hypothetical protein Q9160_007962 [Pyrenula sp. 1 TL-2023]